MSPRTTACVPWYRPHSSAPKVAVMMKPTRNERTAVRFFAVSKAFSVDWSKRAASRAFLHVALHHRHRVQHLGGDGAAVGHAVLAGAAELAHAAAEVQAGQHHQHQDAQHLRHHVGVGHDQRAQRADAHHGVAQAHAEAAADHRLHQRGVGGQPAQHLAGLRGLEELRALPHHVGVDRVAQVGRDALAQPGDHVEARRREQAQRRADAEQRQEVLAQRQQALAGVGGDQALVDQQLQRHREGQRAGRGQHQEDDGQRDAATVGPHEGQQARQRTHALAGCGFAGAEGRGQGRAGGVHGRECRHRRAKGARTPHPGWRRRSQAAGDVVE